MNFENKYVKIDVEHFPQVVFAIKDHKPTEAEFDNFLAAMEDTYANKKVRIVLFDLVNAQNIPITYQLKFARWSKSMELNFEKYLNGVTFHVNSKLMKLLLKSIFFLQKPNYEYQVFDNQMAVEEHQELLMQNLHKAG